MKKSELEKMTNEELIDLSIDRSISILAIKNYRTVHNASLNDALINLMTTFEDHREL